jgi:MFS family permease
MIGLIWVQKYLGKRPLFLISITLMSILNIALVLAMIFEKVLPSLMIMCIFMVVYGGSFISPIWSYPSEIIPASQALLPNIMHWLALAISTLIPPAITGIMPNSNPYPVFIFFGIYGFISMIHVFKSMRESDGKTYNEIINSFK